MMYKAVLVACVVLCAASAPLQTDESDEIKTVDRVKRSEEAIFFGNHQNSARVKKARPSDLISNDRILDQKSELAVDNAPAENKAENSPDLVDETSTSTSPKEKDEQTSLENMIIKQESGERLEDKTEEEEEEQMQEPKEDVQKQVEEDASGEAEDQQETEDLDPDAAPIPPDDDLMGDYYDYLDLGNYYYYPESREKRSAPALTAEDMNGGGNVETRVKRDLGLTEEDIKELLEEDKLGGEDGGYWNPEEGGYAEPVYNDEGDETATIPVDDVTVDDVREMLQELEDSYDGDAAEEVYPSQAFEEEDKEEDDYRPLAEDGYPYLDEQDLEEAKAKLALLRYLYEENREPEFELEEPREVEESWDDLGPLTEEAAGPEYEMIDYRGKRGIFIPVKRQYLSFVPGNKRNFYPASYGPDGRWGAFAPEFDEEKRSEDQMYERLYRLAQALRDREDEDDYKK